MATSDQIRKKFLVLTESKVMYFGEYDGHNGDNICLLNARCLLDCSEPFYKICSNGAFCLLSNMLNHVEIKNVDKAIEISSRVYKVLNSNPVIHSSNVYVYNSSVKKDYYDKMCLTAINYVPITNIQGNIIGVTSRKGRAGSGFVVDITLKVYPCFTVTFGNITGIGESLHSAYENAKELVLNCKKSDFKGYDYAEYVVKKYPDVDAEIPVIELIELHNLITNSCSRGIRNFLKSYNINIDGTVSMRTFLALTKDAYAPEVIESIAKKYGITI